MLASIKLNQPKNKFASDSFALRVVYYVGSGRGAMGKAWVCLPRSPVFDSRRTAVVSGRASDLKCSCAMLVYKSVDPIWYR